MTRRRIPELDGFRVVMVFIVSWFHIWQQSWLTPHVGRVSLDFLVRAGYMAVDATLLLSAFLLCLPWAEARYRGEPADRRLEPARAFYRKRLARVLPSYLFVTALMLFAVAIPQRKYASGGAMALDILTHLTFTFPFTRATYQHTPLGGASWTLAMEVHFYLLLPLLLRGADRKPGAVMAGMAACAAFFRVYCLWALEDYSMVVNQMVNFLDVYALGMACAFCWPRLTALRDRLSGGGRTAFHLGATLVLALGIAGFVLVLRDQAGTGSYSGIQAGQMVRRPLLALACAGIMLSLPLALRPVRLLFGNPVMRFLAGISMNYYLLHQNIAVWLREHNIPFSDLTYPNQAGETVWQLQYTALAFGLSLAAAVLVTYLIEKPGAALLRRLFARMDRRRGDLRSPASPPKAPSST